jgi:hypothetical protein
MTPGASGGIAASGTGGIGLTSGTGFFVRETVGLTLGMPEEYARVVSGNKVRGSDRFLPQCRSANTASAAQLHNERLTCATCAGLLLRRIGHYLFRVIIGHGALILSLLASFVDDMLTVIQVEHTTRISRPQRRPIRDSSLAQLGLSAPECCRSSAPIPERSNRLSLSTCSAFMDKPWPKETIKLPEFRIG